MTNIFDLPSIWRAQMLPAHYNGALFHCELNSREGGRRIALHQFPKKDQPYAEDMGRDAREFSVRGYCIVFPYDQDPLRLRDYRIARELLIHQLEAEGPGILQLPTSLPQLVVCPKFRVTEEERLGGYCVFDMTFREYGIDPQTLAPSVATDAAVSDASQNLRDQVQQSLTTPPDTVAQVT